ncbi:hypothetical protein FQN60_005953 [Etheostoma spectabile]|uniref:CCR4-NOT transcription complex subunit 4 n=1 Tax=Etheostoma spectabile TaxID=54343 RepID=A0A5J5CFK4_9PERO|nr:hypothetical protein FQN60_005953 [Etheostoma spectabile]
MSRNPGVKDDLMECPLCMEPLEIDDVNFFPCTCGYQICRFCWHRIRTDENGLCPACRKPYPEDPAVYKPLSQEELQRIKTEKKQKQNEKKQKITENRKHLASVRVVQRNLVFVVGLSQSVADPEVLRRPEYFGKFGKIHKVVINNSTSYAGSQGPSASAYVTYIRSEDALRAIQCVNNVVVDGRTLKASLGTTKYCSYFLKSMQCPKPDCMYLHELGDEAASFTKEEMQAGKHQEYEQKLLQDLYKSNPTFLQSPAVSGDRSSKDSLSSDPGRSPPSEGSDCEHLTPAGPQTDPSLDPVPALCPFSSQLASPSHTLTDITSIGNGETAQLLRGGSESPSPPPGLSKPSLLLPISVPGHTARSPFEATAAESQSLFSDNNTMPVSSSTDWQAAFGFGSSNQQQDDDLGFDPFDVTRRALADLIEKELSVEDSFGSAHRTLGPLGGFAPSQHVPQHQHPRRADYSSFSFPYHPPSSASPASCGSWMASTSSRRNFVHLNHTVSVMASPSHSRMDLTVLPGHRSTGLGGLPVTESSSRGESLNVKEWQDGLRALLPNININFGGLPNSSSSSLSSSSNVQHTGPPGLPHSLCWDRTARWMDPAIITGIPTSTSNGLDSLQDDNPPHWLKSLQTLTEMDAPSSSVSQNGSMGSQPPPHRAGWAHYPAPSSQFHSPPPGFQTAFRPPTQTQTDLLQSAAIDRH